MLIGVILNDLVRINCECIRGVRLSKSYFTTVFMVRYCELDLEVVIFRGFMLIGIRLGILSFG